MDYTKFHFLCDKVTHKGATDEEEEELIRMLQKHLAEKQQERKNVIYENAANEINASINYFLKISGEQSMRIKIVGIGDKNNYVNIKSVHYNPAQDHITFCTPLYENN